MKADLVMALRFVNQCIGPIEYRWRPQAIMARDLVRNNRGRIKFRVPKMLFPSTDTQGCVLRLLTKTLGQPRFAIGNKEVELYRWNFSYTRALELSWQHNDGTYITLIDEAEQ